LPQSLYRMPNKLVDNLAGKVDYVYIDRMNYSSAIRSFYRYHGLEGSGIEKESNSF